MFRFQSKTARSLPVAALLLIGCNDARGAPDCPPSAQLDDTGSVVEDGALLFRGPDGWLKLSDLESLPPNAALLYVIKAPSPRAGVLVVKSGFLEDQEQPTKTTMVRLSRRPDQLVDGALTLCRSQSRDEIAVPLESYNSYHDLGTRSADEAILSGFHFSYGSKIGNCSAGDLVKRTDSTAIDGIADQRSNRSQFSFDPSVVREGMYSWSSLLFLGKAATTKLRDLKVMAIGYSVKDSACIQFTIDSHGPRPGQFLRINDLESRTPFPPFQRAPERVWQQH
jgi:hypothetical protein